MVELTQKVGPKLGLLSTTVGRDVAYVAAPEHRSGEELLIIHTHQKSCEVFLQEIKTLSPPLYENWAGVRNK